MKILEAQANYQEKGWRAEALGQAVLAGFIQQNHSNFLIEEFRDSIDLAEGGVRLSLEVESGSEAPKTLKVIADSMVTQGWRELAAYYYPELSRLDQLPQYSDEGYKRPDHIWGTEFPKPGAVQEWLSLPPFDTLMPGHLSFPLTNVPLEMPDLSDSPETGHTRAYVSFMDVDPKEHTINVGALTVGNVNRLAFVQLVE